MEFPENLLNLDYLVYSSHKTGTQTLVETLNSSGFRCRHCHVLGNMGLSSGEFRRYLDRYLERNNRKLNVITVFREPVERHVSSFFQGHGSRPLRLNEVKSRFETIIYKHTIEQLQELFVSELRSRSIIGFSESLHELCRECAVDTSDLAFDESRQSGVFETPQMRIYLFRFDLLFSNLTKLLSEITGRTLCIRDSNMSNSKWYRDIYTRFKSSLVIPGNVVSETYGLKGDLIRVFYSGDYASALSRAMVRYGNST
ncbi:MAG: hypothetical protein KDG50_13790 [Chromatiales bacterium]|nr:hypothetical protein [Chromatiales bacterium]